MSMKQNSPSSDIPLKDISTRRTSVAKVTSPTSSSGTKPPKRNKAATSVVASNISSSRYGADLCDTSTCLEIIEHHNETGDLENDLSTSCKVCAAKQASTAVLIFEAIPLSVKLLFIVSFAVVSLMVFGAILIVGAADTMKNSNYIERVAKITAVLSDLIQELQVERSYSVIYYLFPSPAYHQTISLQYNKTDGVLNRYLSQSLDWSKEIKGDSDGHPKTPESIYLKFQEKLNSIDSALASEGYVSKMDYFTTNLPNHRSQVLKLQFNSTIPILDFYSKWVENTIDGITVLSKASKSSAFQSTHQSYSLVTTLKELTNLKRSVLVYLIMNAKFDVEIYNYIQFLNSKYSIIYGQFDMLSSAELRDFYTQRISDNARLENLLDYFENEVIAHAAMGHKLNFTYDDVYSNFTTKINNLRTVEVFLQNATMKESNELQSLSLAGLLGYSISTVFVVLISIIIALFISSTILLPWKRLLHLQKEKTKELTVSYTQLNLLLERISQEEQKTRKILNSMEDALITINSYGFIVHCNESFYRMFKFNESDIYGMKIKIQQLIPNLDLKELFIQFSHLDTVITPNKDLKAISKSGTDFPVRVSLNFCKLYTNDLVTPQISQQQQSSTATSNSEETSSANHSNNSGGNTSGLLWLSTDKILQQEQACTILIHNLSETYQNDIKTKEKEDSEIIEFKEMFNNPLKKLEFKNYCKHHSLTNIVNNIQFLEDVVVYKNSTSIQERVNLQNQMYYWYLENIQDKNNTTTKRRALCGISNEILNIYSFRINKGLGELELFDGLERIVMEVVVNDSYKKWKEHEKSDFQSYM
ncbi:hypothetical protein ABK040_002454 [Willaertia magna]